MQSTGTKLSGVHEIWIDGVIPTNVFCNMDIDGGGWTVIQRRVDNSTDFNRTWTRYRQGFGNLSINFWLGLDAIHNLTKKGSMLRIDVTKKVDGSQVYTKYNHFKIGNESTNYKLHISGYAGSYHDGFVNSDGTMFTTKDRHNGEEYINCATKSKGGWWHLGCYNSLNGLFPGPGITIRTLAWGQIMIYSEMKIRGKQNSSSSLNHFIVSQPYVYSYFL